MQQQDEKLISLYIGETNNTLKGKFNIKIALINTFLQSIWYLYNKAYICFILTEITSFIIPFPIMFLINGFFGEEFYIKEIRRKILKIKKKNQNLNEKELAELIKEKGKKNKILTILYIIFCLLITLIIIAIITCLFIFLVCFENLTSVG